ncbi:MAG TPA: GGDEF domain-containing protein [Alphaproteobacteria bacterium]|nr:GGDEF domain-containing protein [Alphaproteobacteria bacterium]
MKEFLERLFKRTRNQLLRKQLAAATAEIIRLRADKVVRDLRIRDLESERFQDALTKISNRKFLEEKRKELDDNTRRHDEGYAFIILDIDNFKSVNDTHGHGVGDWVLKEVARAIKDCTRPQDASGFWGKNKEITDVGRLGGEEFVILAGRCESPENAGKIAERARAAIEALEFSVDDKTILKVTASFGVAVFDPKHPQTPEEMYNQADAALYVAKGKNQSPLVPADEPLKNRVCICTPEGIILFPKLESINEQPKLAGSPHSHASALPLVAPR